MIKVVKKEKTNIDVFSVYTEWSQIASILIISYY